MENIQRLMRCHLVVMAVFFIASTAFLQAQRSPYRGGNLTIIDNDDVPSDVTTITTVDGSLSISGGISEFPDFAALEEVRGNLTIEDLGLTTLPRIFPALTLVGGNILIWDNARLTSITGFNALETVTGALRIGNPNGVNGTIPVGNARLQFLPDFAALTEVEGTLHISRNAVRNLPDFAALTAVGGVTIINNSRLRSLSGFEALERIGGDFFIVNNDEMESLTGFGSLTRVGGVVVRGNDVLSLCCGLFSFFDGTIVLGRQPDLRYDLNNNATGCNNVDKITNACFPAFTISDNSTIPSNVTEISRIRGDLTISGSITEFPNFAYLEVVEGNLTINNLTTATLTSLDDIFLFLEEVQGDLVITNNAFVESLTGFRSLTSIGGALYGAG